MKYLSRSLSSLLSRLLIVCLTLSSTITLSIGTINPEFKGLRFEVEHYQLGKTIVESSECSINQDLEACQIGLLILFDVKMSMQDAQYQLDFYKETLAQLGNLTAEYSQEDAEALSWPVIFLNWSIKTYGSLENAIQAVEKEISELELLDKQYSHDQVIQLIKPELLGEDESIQTALDELENLRVPKLVTWAIQRYGDLEAAMIGLEQVFTKFQNDPVEETNQTVNATEAEDTAELDKEL